MLTKCSLTLAVLFSFAAALFAQDKTSDLSLNVAGVVTTQSQNNGVLQTSNNSGALLGTFRHHFSPRIAADVNYSLTKNTQYYTVSAAGTSGSFYSVQSYVNEATADLMLSAFHRGRLDPFLLAGGGALIFSPTGYSGGTSSQEQQVRPAFLYGGGTDVNVFRNVALRLQYRGLFYRAPDFGVTTLSTSMITHTAEPSVGIVYHFSLPRL